MEKIAKLTSYGCYLDCDFVTAKYPDDEVHIVGNVAEYVYDLENKLYDLEYKHSNLQEKYEHLEGWHDAVLGEAIEFENKLRLTEKALELACQTIKSMCPPLWIGGNIPAPEPKDVEYFMEIAKEYLDKCLNNCPDKGDD